ncbi:transient-receptor-potential-like protein [Uloborus diversus]|uniref:transient-receptor-potential-like protein n=1 Tax=Uloborus diversus TaxID=327109 RepID=UPI00240A0005|nr:transient-receptor-potential-like protein [Uloborus diversus]
MRKLEDNDDKEWSNVMYSQHPSLRKLEPIEKQFLLAVEKGDVVRVARMLDMSNRNRSLKLDINCKDPVGRSATLMAIDNENLEMLELLLENGVESRDALLHAINAEYVEAVDLLLEHEEIVHKDGDQHSWEKVDRDISTFTPEITPLILAAHKDNYEILKILLDRGATLPMPHDVRCPCSECVRSVEEDCLCHSRSRINAYRALSSPSLICLSSIDPILTAFELSWELRRLSRAENEFQEDYLKLRQRCQDFATTLLDHARSSRELEMVLNYDPTRPVYQHGEHMPLARLEMALKYKQKKFIAHPNVQQLLSTLWYDGLPGFRKQNPIYQLWDIIKIGVLFPLYSVMYMMLPNSKTGQLVRKPFFKFIIHSFSYLFFLFLLILASQRIETVLARWFGNEEMQIHLTESLKRQRGQPPTIIESTILVYIIAHIWQETKELWTKGLVLYFHNLWNIIDFIRNSLYVGTAGMRVLAYIQAQVEIADNPMSVYIPREAWNAYDPMLIADGLFAAGNVFAALKLVHIFSINPYLGPLQISLGRMVIDIIKFFFIYALVLFAFACGLNQLLWYYADMEKQQCFSGPNGTENWTHQRDSCLAWRRFSNLFESSQTLFWASFGLVDISNFELTGIKSYTRFWGLLMFGSYSVINVVVLLNLLIAMMSNSYNIISERSDMEWKFARTTLFMNYFEEGSTVPPPFNIFPTFKHFLRLFGKKTSFKDMSFRRKETKMKERDTIYQAVMCNLVWRYVTAQQRETESHPVTEDNINELRQDIYSFKHDLMRVLKGNGMSIKDVEKDKIDVTGKRVQIRKRRLIKDFSIGLMEVYTDEAAPEVASNKSMLARLVGLTGAETRSSQRWRDLIQAAKKSKIIGNREESGRFGSIKRSQSEEEQTDQNEVRKTDSEFQKSECPGPVNQSSDLYPKIPEDLNIIPNTQTTTIVSQPTSSTLPLASTKKKSESQNPKLESSIERGIKLSPDTLPKNPKKYQAPNPAQSTNAKIAPSTEKDIVNENAAPHNDTKHPLTPIKSISSFNDKCQKIDRAFGKSAIKPPYDTAINVTPCMGNASNFMNETSVEIICSSESPRFVSCNESRDNSFKHDDINDNLSVDMNQMQNVEDNLQLQNRNERFPMESQPATVSESYSQYMLQNESQSVSANRPERPSPVHFERHGWL